MERARGHARLPRLAREGRRAGLITIVVDNGSTDGTPEAVREALPGGRARRDRQNLGFAEGNNVGIRRALERGADYVLVLNNDVEVDPAFVSALVEEAGRRPDAGALCSKILYAEPERPDLVRRRELRPALRLQRPPARLPRDATTAASTRSSRPTAPAAPRCSSRAPCSSRSASSTPSSSAYSEDTDWSLRAREAGYRHYVVPASRIWHKVSASSGGESSPTTLYYGIRNTIAVCERHAPLGRFGTWRRRSILLAAHLAQAGLSSRKREGLAAVAQGWRDVRAGRFGQRPSK